MSSAEVLQRLRSAGWFEVDRKGSHVQLKHATRKGRVTVPHPRRDIPIGTLRSIEKQSGVSMRSEPPSEPPRPTRRIVALKKEET